MMKEFESTANAGNHAEHGWHNSTYSGKKRIDSILMIRIHHIYLVDLNQLDMDPPKNAIFFVFFIQ